MVYVVNGFYVGLALMVLAAWRWGGWPERRAAAMYLVAATLTLAARFPGTSSYTTLQALPAAVDLALFVGLLSIALGSNRWWPILATALQATTVLGHLAKLGPVHTDAFDYFMTNVGSSYPSLILLGLGVLNHWRRAQDQNQMHRAE